MTGATTARGKDLISGSASRQAPAAGMGKRYDSDMPKCEYLVVTVNHEACEINVARGDAPEDVQGGHFRLPGVFNQLEAEGWLLRASVHE